jgi:NAD(P)-dependent dehydrogenase (short-subunit alcohol dehydrogenase family)
MATVLITGANRGIGFEYCRQLASRGDSVVAVCRHPSPDLQDLDVRIEAGVEVTDAASITALVERLQGLPIDVLINNAGSLRRQFEVNAIAPLCLTRALLSQLQPGSKVILMTSRMGSIEDNTSGNSYGYRMSKVALCMAGKSLSIDLKPRGVAVGILHPGMVSTGMTGFTSQGIAPRDSVRGLLNRIDDLTLENSGTFWHANGEVLPW